MKASTERSTINMLNLHEFVHKKNFPPQLTLKTIVAFSIKNFSNSVLNMNIFLKNCNGLNKNNFLSLNLEIVCKKYGFI